MLIKGLLAQYKQNLLLRIALITTLFQLKHIFGWLFLSACRYDYLMGTQASAYSPKLQPFHFLISYKITYLPFACGRIYSDFASRSI